MDIDLDRVCSALGVDPAHAELEPFTSGAYHAHTILRADGRELLLRRCIGSQWGLAPADQLAREYRTLGVLHDAAPGVGPAPRALVGEILVEERLRGRAFSYGADLEGLAASLAAVHAIPAPAHLPAVDAVAELTADGRAWLDRAPATSGTRLLASFADGLAGEGSATGAVLCHTDLNPGNLIVGEGGRVRLVDWEAARGGDAAWDLAHALAPTTTSWSDDAPMTLPRAERSRMLAAYVRAGGGSDVTARVPSLHAAVVFRALAWCAGFDESGAPELAPRLARLRHEDFISAALEIT